MEYKIALKETEEDFPFGFPAYLDAGHKALPGMKLLRILGMLLDSIRKLEKIKRIKAYNNLMGPDIKPCIL